MIDPRKLAIEDFTYHLSDEKIAQFPLPNRSDSKLLYFNANRQIMHQQFTDLPNLIPSGSLMIMNNTKVIRARLFFTKLTGAKIEVFCLEPELSLPIEQAFQTKGRVLWLCLIGNAKKWKQEILISRFNYNGIKGELKAKKVGEKEDLSIIEFTWDPSDLTFSEMLSYSGLIPLPPYMKRETIDSDKENYNTVYAKNDGSVAAPTSGLHFTSSILNQLIEKGVKLDYLTLHVGAGTFMPVKAALMEDHIMHDEQISISLKTLELIRDTMEVAPIIAVGTTSTRTLESVYWHAIKLMKNETKEEVIYIDQWFPYQFNNEELPSSKNALIFLCDWMKKCQLNKLAGSTKIIIAPGYRMKMLDAIITNFHQPQSTLLLLVAALIGNDWNAVYNSALENNYRFLSYGDSSLLFKNPNV